VLASEMFRITVLPGAPLPDERLSVTSCPKQPANAPTLAIKIRASLDGVMSLLGILLRAIIVFVLHPPELLTYRI
jgi:hypothetical protein